VAVSLYGALVGVIAAAGVLVFARGWAGVPDRPATHLPDFDAEAIAKRVGPALLGFLVVLWLSGWPAAGLAVGAIALMVPLFFDAARRRRNLVDRADALAAWADMLRDTIVAHAGLQQAIVSTAEVAPSAIRTPVRTLAVRSGRMSLSDALGRFAAEMADPVADKIVAAIVIADAHQAQNLPQLLGEIAQTTRDQASMRRRVETSRARTYASSRAMVIITGTMVVGLAVLSPEFMAPYDRFWGQVVLGIAGALFAGAVWGLIQLSRPVAEPRVLAGIEAERGRR
jgi:tight adherence protein B